MLKQAVKVLLLPCVALCCPLWAVETGVPLLHLKKRICFNPVQQFYQKDVTGDGVEEILFFREKTDIGFALSVVYANDFKYHEPYVAVESQQCPPNNQGFLELFYETPAHPTYAGFTITVEHECVVLHFLDHTLKTMHEITVAEKYQVFNGPAQIEHFIGAEILDWNGDGRYDVLFGLSRGVEEKPRGFYGVDVHSGERIFNFDVAPMVIDGEIKDFNRDGKAEILFSTAGASDGPFFGPLARDSSYLALYHASGQVDVLYRYAGESSYTHFITEDITGDGYEDVLVFSFCNIEPATRPSELAWIDGYSLSMGETITGEMEFKDIFVAHAGGQTLLYNSDFNHGVEQYRFDPERRQLSLIRARDLNKPLYFLLADDINNDGDDELFFINREAAQVEIYTAGLDLLARFSVSEGSRWVKIEPVKTQRLDERHYLVLDMGKNFFRLRIPLDTLFPPEPLWGQMPLYGWLVPALLLALLVWALQARQGVGGVSAIDKSTQVALLQIDGRSKVQRVNHQFVELFELGNVVHEKQWLEELLPASAFGPLLERVGRFQNGRRDYAAFDVQISIHGTLRDLSLECFKNQQHGKREEVELLIMDASESNQAERLKAWAAMAQRVVHKTKTPLGTIMLALQRLQRIYQKECAVQADAFDAHLNPALHEIRRVRDQVNLFVKFSRVHEGQKERRDLNHVMKDIIDEYRTAMPRGVQLTLHSEAHVLPVDVDEEQIIEAVRNHLDNAVTAVKGDGQIVVSLLEAQHPLEAYGSGRSVLIEIQDDGAGISTAGLEKLFSPGYTTSDHGSGMGMVISKSIVEGHGGEIEISSQEGLGTTVQIKLPIQQDNG